MAIRLTGISTPFVGAEWEYINDDKTEERSLHLTPGRKIRVFISSICGVEKYDRVRSELKEKLEATGIADVYTFENEEASSLPAGYHFKTALEDCDICVFLIDNYDGIREGVQAEIDTVTKLKKKALYYFCDEKSSEPTALQKNLTGAQYAKSKIVHKFEELSKNSATALIEDVVRIYHEYCAGRLRLDGIEEPVNRVNIEGVEKYQYPVIPKSVLSNADKCRNSIIEFILGNARGYEVSNTGELDEWAHQFLEILLGGTSIKQFNVSMYLESLAGIQADDYHKVVVLRWEAIQAYYNDDIQQCLNKLREALDFAKETNQPTWVINDLLIDIRNQHYTRCNLESSFSQPPEQDELSKCDESIYIPVLDRIYNSLHEQYIQELYKEKLKSPYTITYGSNINQSATMLASIIIVSMYNGSLTHILLVHEELRNFLFYLCSRYDDWCLRLNLFKITVLTGRDKDIDGVRDAYPEILNNLNSEEASQIMRICNSIPIKQVRTKRQLLAFGAVGYYLDDKEFDKYAKELVAEAHAWFRNENSTVYLGDAIFKGLSGVTKRLSQDTLAELCCECIEHQYRRFYIDLFKFIENNIDLSKMRHESAEKLMDAIISLFSEEKDRNQIKYASGFLVELRNQSKALTERMDHCVKEYYPEYYENNYRINTEDLEQRIPELVEEYVHKINKRNEEQGKDGVFFRSGENAIGTIKNILQSNTEEIDVKILDPLIAAVIKTLTASQEGIEVKIEAIRLLTCIVIKYPEGYKNNYKEYEELFANREKIENELTSVIESNIDSVALKIGLQVLYLAMGKDVYTNIIELIPFIKDDVASCIATSHIFLNYLVSDCNIVFPIIVESLVLQTVLQWLRSENTDLRWNALRIMCLMSRSNNNAGVVNHQLINLVNTDNVYIKYYILHNLYKARVISEETRDYILNKCSGDSNYVIREYCKEINQKRSIGDANNKE